MKKNTRADKAHETIAIIEKGFYQAGADKIHIKDEIQKSVEGSILYRSEEFEPVFVTAGDKLGSLRYETKITVVNTTVLEAAAKMAEHGASIGCLNFASAKNPGGGFLGGAQAQEESLALSSTLYPTLMKHFEMYAYNRDRNTYLYSDYMIYSPDVIMIRNDDGDLLPVPYKMSFVTSPAVNVGAMKSNRPGEMTYAKETMLCRMDKVLSTFLSHGAEHLLLGAWGCGVFQNDPKDIAAYFAHYLLNNGKYSRCFKTVVFAVLDRSKDGYNIAAFENVLSCKKNES